MQDYDATLKLLLQKSSRLIQALVGTPVVKWLDVELPKVQNPRVDLLGETADGRLIHVELQSTYDPHMALRMAEYKLGICRQYGRLPRQILLYVGEAPLRMPNELGDEDLSFRYSSVDIRSLDGEPLLASAELGDNVVAILARLRDHKEAVRRIVQRIAELPPAERQDACKQLMILAGLRRKEILSLVQEEVLNMPITIDIRDVFAPQFEEAEQRARQKGRQEGRQEGELVILRRLIEKRFGAIPGWAEQRLSERPAAELEALGVRLLDAGSLEELLG